MPAWVAPSAPTRPARSLAKRTSVDQYRVQGRGGLEDWHKLGYVSIEGSDRSGSVDMEYAANDFEIALTDLQPREVDD